MKVRLDSFVKPSLVLCLSLVLTIFSSCSTSTDTSLETQYYLLNSNQQVKSTDKKVNKTVVVNLLELPAYLYQPHLVMQLDEHRLHYARFDMWAEPLQVGLSKALINDLNLNDKGLQFITEDLGIGDQYNHKITVQVDNFHAKTDSKVVLSGMFWMKVNGKLVAKQHPFSFELLLKEDGYSHAISQMRQLISMMSAAMLSTKYN